MKFNFWKKWYFWLWVIADIVYGYAVTYEIIYLAEHIGFVLGSIVKVFIMYYIIYLSIMGCRKLFKLDK